MQVKRLTKRPRAFAALIRTLRVAQRRLSWRYEYI